MLKNIFTCIILMLLMAVKIIAQKNNLYQPAIENRAVNLLHEKQFHFKDLNKNNILDVYEDWRKPLDLRVANLVSLMTLEEKVGMLLINTLNAGEKGKMTDAAVDLIEKQKMTRFVFRNTIKSNPVSTGAGNGFAGAQISPFEAAQFMNAVQEFSERTRLGIPALFKSNSRNHIEFDARAGINIESGSFSSWPKESGLAATRDMALIADFAKIMAEEWRAIGLRGMYGYMADLSTEPRWYRVHETFTEDSDLAAEIIKV
ncbi:MAG: glycoside hydrolase family 3 N-terminal domain-containing protein, partial [Bacteroidota bacterium]